MLPLFLSFFLSAFVLNAATTQSPNSYCDEWMEKFPGTIPAAEKKSICTKVAQLDVCKSQQDQLPIFHYDHVGNSSTAKKILVLSMVHGDEYPAGSVVRRWLERLQHIPARNNWRVIPILNPDGVKNKTRVNARGVDINRNMPTKNWDLEAHDRWTKIEKKSPRRFPGDTAASEQETLCLMKHIEEYKPDFVISIHTPYGILDFDGPEGLGIPLQKITDLPWKKLGHFPGSLGRYLWAERGIPVLTIELKGNTYYQSNKYMDHLQDSLGTFAMNLLAQRMKQGIISSSK